MPMILEYNFIGHIQMVSRFCECSEMLALLVPTDVEMFDEQVSTYFRSCSVFLYKKNRAFEDLE